MGPGQDSLSPRCLAQPPTKIHGQWEQPRTSKPKSQSSLGPFANWLQHLGKATLPSLNLRTHFGNVGGGLEKSREGY